MSKELSAPTGKDRALKLDTNQRERHTGGEIRFSETEYIEANRSHHYILDYLTQRSANTPVFRSMNISSAQLKKWTVSLAKFTVPENGSNGEEMDFASLDAFAIYIDGLRQNSSTKRIINAGKRLERKITED